jgi:S-(hydroxymethyl)glutathione dehydrogenase/alcohol dehydrogenase
VVEEIGPEARGVAVGDHVVLSWNPHCGHCFYCDRDLPILCETYLAQGPKAVGFDGDSRARLADGRELKQLMFIGGFGEYAVVADHQAIVVPKELPFDRACLIGCGVMTGVGAALNIARIAYGDTVMVIGCGAVGLSAVQGARLAGAGQIIAVDLDGDKLALAERVGATLRVDARNEDAVAIVKTRTGGRGVDVVLEAAGSGAGFRTAVEAVRPGGEVIWLGKIDGQRGCLPLGQPDGGTAHPPLQLRRRPAGPRLPALGARLSRRPTLSRRADHPPHPARRHQ